MLFRLIVAPLLITLISWLPSWAADDNAPEELQVVASIRPLALIAEDLIGELGRVETLVSGAASPHDYALKVSDMRRLHNAELVLWMGPELERFLQKPLRGLDKERVLALGEGEGSSHDHHDKDLHQWLDPTAAQEMAEQIAKRLSQLFPELGDKIQERLAAQLEAYRSLDAEIQKLLAPLRERGFVVQHRGYDQFVEAYDLQQVGWLSVSPEQPPGARHLYQLEQKLDKERVACLFVEAQHQSPLASNFADKFNLPIATLDILGYEAESYSALMRNLAFEVASCLAR